MSASSSVVDSLLALQSVKISEDSQYCILAYFIIDPPQKGNHGMWIFLGAYSTTKKAIAKCQKIMMETGYKCLLVRPAGKWNDLLENPDTGNIKWIPADKEALLRDERRKQYKMEQKEHETRERIEREIVLEKERELDSNSVEYYTHQWYLVIKQLSDVKHYREELRKAEARYQERVTKIREAFTYNPEHEKNWLTILEPKLKERHEGHIFEMLNRVHGEICEEVLGPILCESLFR